MGVQLGLSPRGEVGGQNAPIKKGQVPWQKGYKQAGVSLCGLAIYILKYLKAKEEELWKLKYISPCKNIL